MLRVPRSFSVIHYNGTCQLQFDINMQMFHLKTIRAHSTHIEYQIINELRFVDVCTTYEL